MNYTSRAGFTKLLVGLTSCAAVLLAVSAIGQQQKSAGSQAAKAPPKITSIFPGGARRGATTQIEVKGKNLAALTELYFSRRVGTLERIEAKTAEQAVATLKIDGDAEIGTVELRALSGEGISNLKLFRIDEFPETLETTEKNDTTAQAQEIDFPIVVNGQLGTAADVDYYRISIKEQTRLIIEIEARRIGSPVEARLRLLSSNGRLLADAAATRAIRPDERLDYQFTKPGEYILAVEDAQYVGGDAAVYRLRLGSWPYATTMFPLGGRRGESIELTLEGGNLPEPIKHRLKLPSDSQTDVLRPQLPIEQGLLVAPMLLALGDDPEEFEREANDDPKEPQPIVAPCVVNGHIGQPGDKDRFLVKAKKGEKLTVEVFADRLGSWLDSVLTVTDKNGKQVQENDDQRPGNQRQNQQAKTGVMPISDSRLEFSVGTDGEYVITIDDRYHSGGPEFAYRLVITPARPDFLLTYGPAPAQKNQPQQKKQQATGPTDIVNLESGKSVPVPVNVTRRGYDGEILLAVEGLPAGLDYEPGKIPAKQAGGQVTIKADEASPSRIERVHVVGVAKINDQEIRRLAQHEIIVAQLDPLHTARVESADLTLAIVRREPPLVLKVEGETVLACGMVAELKVAVERKGGFKGPVDIKLDKLPKGVTAENITLAENETEAVIRLVSAADTSIGKQKIQVISQGKFGAATVDASQEIMLAVVPPFELTLDPKEPELELVVGGASTLKLGVRRQANFDGAIELAVTGLPDGVSVTPEKIETGQGEVEINFLASDETKPNQSKTTIKIQATGEINGQRITFETAAIQLTVKQSESAP